MATSSSFPTSNQYIKYQIEVTENSTSVANNTSSVTVKVKAWRTNSGYTTYGSGTCYCNINGTAYSQTISSSQKLTYNSYTVLFSTTVTIPHNADGTKSIFVEAKITHARFTSDYHGFTVALTDIPRQATVTAVQNFNDEANPTITYSNPAGNAVSSLQACISLTGSASDVPYRDISKTGSSYTFNLTTAERNTLRASMPNSNSRTVYFYVKTVIAGQTYYSNKPATLTIVNGNPTISGVSYKDNNSTTVAITTNNQYIIQNKSQLLFTFSSLTSKKSATLSSIAVEINSEGQAIALTGSSASNVSLSYGLLDASENQTATIVLTDSRGNKTSMTMNILVYQYYPPIAFGTAKRLSNFYDTTTITNNSRCSSIGGHNTLTVTWKYKERTASSYTTGGTLPSESSTTVSLDNTKAWDVQFVATDRLESRTYNVIVPVGIPLLYFDTKKNSVGIKALTSSSNQIAIGQTLEMLSRNNNVIGSFVQFTSDSGDSSGIQFFSDASSNRKMRAMFSGSGYGMLQLFANAGSNTIQANGESGDVRCVTLTQTSSRKVKENINEMSLDEAEKILQLIAVTFDYVNHNQGTDMRGFIAEDVAEIIPELVTEETENAPASLSYVEMIPYLQTVIKNQEERIRALEDRIKALEDKE